MSEPSGLLKDDPKYQPFIDDALARLKNQTQLSILQIIGNVLSTGDILILGTMGLDAKQKLLDVIIEECQKLKEEYHDE